MHPKRIIWWLTMALIGVALLIAYAVAEPEPDIAVLTVPEHLPAEIWVELNTVSALLEEVNAHQQAALELQQRALGDFNGDGQVTLLDVPYFQAALAGAGEQQP